MLMVLRMALLTAIVGGAAYAVPTRYMLRAPGHADELTDIVKVAGGQKHPGSPLFMTTVIYERANLLYCLYAAMDPNAELIPQETHLVFLTWHPNERPDDHLPLYSMESMMEQSKHLASVAALHQLGYAVEVESTGLRIRGFLERAPASKVLRPNDVIEWADGKRVRSVKQLRAIVGIHGLQRPLPLKLRRDQRYEELSVPLMRHSGRVLIGIDTEEVRDDAKLPLDVKITTHNVNGASAGLMFALEIIDQLTPGGITAGRRVAGTGTIEADGRVGAIEGVELKQVAAQRAGATVFLVPTENLHETRSMPGMRVVAVNTLRDALEALRQRF